MLQLDEISYTIDKDGEDFDLIHKASLKVAPGHFMAIVGPSGCGKTTLLKIIAGLYEESAGNIYWQGRNLAEEEDLEPAEIGYVPQFSIAYDHLTVEESIETAIRLRMKTRSRKHMHAIADEIIRQVGLGNIANNLVKVISGGQKRRLGLALELVSNPTLLLCDEVTSGLDPKAEREIVHLMHGLAAEQPARRHQRHPQFEQPRAVRLRAGDVPGLHRVPRAAEEDAPLLQRRASGGGLSQARQALVAQLARVLDEALRLLLQGLRARLRRPPTGCQR